MKTSVSKLNEMNLITHRSSADPARIYTNAVRSMKRICYLFMLTGIAALFSSCEVGWVATEPTYGVEIERPAPPGAGFIWIDGGWRWDYGRHNYIREPGYWARSRHNQSYVHGYWQSGPRGKAWVKGHWSRGHDRDNRR